ncbi:helicase POLQ-like isoform X2 [Tubulanus polymorphus]|uniref:helicase POLQ-like isoform X2 n=1 Tax=Tubulanus polymorphus TaxID=672921 RepID=UPI003DA1D87D
MMDTNRKRKYSSISDFNSAVTKLVEDNETITMSSITTKKVSSVLMASKTPNRKTENPVRLDSVILSPGLNDSDLELAGIDIDRLQQDYESQRSQNTGGSVTEIGDRTYKTDILDEIFADEEKINSKRRPSPRCKKSVLGKGVEKKPVIVSSNGNSDELNGSLPLFESDDDIWPTSEPPIERKMVGVCDNNSKHSVEGISVIETESTDSVSDDRFRPIRVSEQTPRPATSIASRIRRSLQNNAKQTTPQNNRIEMLRREVIKRTNEEVANIKETTVDWARGPFFGLPSKVKGLFEKHRGIKSLYAWQEECLNLPAVRNGSNLIYSLPTSGGKTLVAEILMLQQILCHKKDAILILPFVSIVQEKVKGLSAFAVDLDFLMEEYAASKGAFPPRKRRKHNSIYIATIEKSNTLISCLIELKRLCNIGLVVVDELHMLGEGGSRGATLEVALTKLLHAEESPQIVGMSATLSNISDLTTFLRAELYTNDFRPVKLVEYVKVEDNIFEVKKNVLCPDDVLHHKRIVTFPYDLQMRRRDPDHLLGLVLEVVPTYSCLVFCPTKKNCENVAVMLCDLIPKEILQVKQNEKKILLQQLKDDNNGKLCPILQRTVRYGIAYHHSGLTGDERKLIEDAYSAGTLCTLTCTSTLAAGVNLPAKRVILRAPNVGADMMSSSQYKQMVGRAGRAGIDSSGESILIVKPAERRKILNLISGPMDSCKSSLLYDNGKGMRALILSLIGLQVAQSTESVLLFIQSTLYSVQCDIEKRNDIFHFTKDALEKLIEMKLIRQKMGDPSAAQKLLETTPLGRAAYKGGVDVDRANQLYKDLCQAQESLVIANYLHLLYLATPYDMVNQAVPTWMIYLQQITRLEPNELKVATLIGVHESYIAKKVTGQTKRKNVDEFMVNRFYLTLVLYDLWKQTPVWDVALKYQLPRGFVQNLLTAAASFAACITHFCQELEEFWAYQELMTGFVRKLSYCVSMELIPLMEVPGVKQARAKQLFKAGYKSLTHLSHADPEILVKSIEHMPRKLARQIVASAKLLLTEKAEALREEADELIATPKTPLLILDT